MKKNYLKIMIYSLITIMSIFILGGCNSEGIEGTNSDSLQEISTIESEEDIVMVAMEDETEEDIVSEDISEEISEGSSEAISEEISEDATNDVFEEISEDVVEEVSEENIPSYTVEPMEATMYAQRAVNVRIGPGTDYEKIGGLTTNQEVTVTGKASTGWYEISYNNGIGYVSNNYLGNDMVVVEQAPAPVTPEPNNTEVTPEIGTDDWTWDELTTYTITDVYLEPDMLGLVNGYRSENGIPELTWDTAREQEALQRAKEISQNFSHEGMPSSAIAENITFVAIDGNANTYYMNYYNSPGHNANMLRYSVNATSHSMLSATCVTTNAAGGKRYFNVFIIYAEYPDSFSTVDWGNLGGTGN